MSTASSPFDSSPDSVSPPDLFSFSDEPAIVAQLRAAGCVFAEDEADLLLAAARTPDELADMVARRVSGLPLEHVLGWAEFCGLRIAVDPGVFVPRRRTEFLAHQATALAEQAGSGHQRSGHGRSSDGRSSYRRRVVVVDLCCGSGAVGTAVATALTATALTATGDGLDVYAADLDPVAVRCARRNLAGVDGHVFEGDLYAAFPEELRGHVDVLVANAPYVPTDAIALLPPEARDHEPYAALDGGVDGLDVVRRVIAEAPSWLAPGGHLLIETSQSQVDATLEAAVRAGLSPRVATSDEVAATVVIAANPVPRKAST